MEDLFLLDLILIAVRSYSYSDFSYTVLSFYMYVYLSQAYAYFDLPWELQNLYLYRGTKHVLIFRSISNLP